MNELRSKLIERLTFLVIVYAAVWKVIKRDDAIKKFINRKKNKKKNYIRPWGSYLQPKMTMQRSAQKKKFIRSLYHSPEILNTNSQTFKLSRCFTAKITFLLKASRAKLYVPTKPIFQRSQRGFSPPGATAQPLDKIFDEQLGSSNPAAVGSGARCPQKAQATRQDWSESQCDDGTCDFSFRVRESFRRIGFPGSLGARASLRPLSLSFPPSRYSPPAFTRSTSPWYSPFFATFYLHAAREP